MNQNPPNLAALAELAHRALNADDTEYTLAKAAISQFFRPSCAVAHKEEVRLTLIDSLFSTNVAAKRLFGISDIAQSLRGAFPCGDDVLKESAMQWIDSGFNSANPLYLLFVTKYDTSKRYAALINYCNGEKSPEAVINELRTGKNAAALRDIFGTDLYAFIQQSAALGKE
jgi:hypothetical protein